MSSLSAILNQLSEFFPRSIPPAEFKAALALCVNADTQPSAEGCISGLQNNLPVEFLFEKELLQGPIRLCRIHQDYI